MTDRATPGWIRATAIIGTGVVAAGAAFTGLAWAHDRSGRASALDESFIVVLEPGSVPGSDVPAMADRLAARYDGAVNRTWQDALLGFEVSMSREHARRLANE